MDLTVIKYVAGFVLPVAVDFINKRIKNHKIKYVVALLLSVVVGALFHINELTNAPEVLATIGIVFAESQTIYKLYWEKSELRAKML